MPIYMQFTRTNGSVIKGDVTESDHLGWIELQSAQLGINRRITNPSGQGANRDAQVPTVSEIVVTKDQDSASNELFRQSLWGDAATVEIDFVKHDGGTTSTTMSVTLEGTQVSNFSTSGSGGDAHQRPTESLSLNFQSIVYSTEGPGRLIPGARTTPPPPAAPDPHVKGRVKGRTK
jgi:type VI secretion system secreted protein Hcp